MYLCLRFPLAASADPPGMGTARQIAAAVDSMYTHALLKVRDGDFQNKGYISGVIQWK
jgi:hypothetical protein